MDRIRSAVRAGALGPGALVGALILVTGLIAPAAAAPPTQGYTTTLLSMEPSSVGNPVNRSGLVAGSINMGADQPTSAAVVWDPRAKRTRAVPDPLAFYNRATDINDPGEVSGWSRTSNDPTGPRQAWVWHPGTARRQQLAPADEQVSSAANSVNDSGVVAGFQSRRGSPLTPRAVTWDTRVTPARQQQLGTLGGSTSEALSIDSAGYVVGSSTNARGITRPFLWLPELKAMTDIGSLPGFDSGIAEDISDGSRIVGEMFNQSSPYDTQAFVWSPVTHQITALGAPGAQSVAHAVNYHGLVVGRSLSSAVLWNSCRTAVTDLPGLDAYGINRTETIAGYTYAYLPNAGPPYLDGATFRKAGPCT